MATKTPTKEKEAAAAKEAKKEEKKGHEEKKAHVEKKEEKKDEKKDKADPSKKGAPIVDANKREEDRKKVMKAGLLGALGDGYRVEVRIVVWSGDDVVQAPAGAVGVLR